MSTRNYDDQNRKAKEFTSGVLFYSYETPVVARIGDDFYVTTEKYSVTTSKHVNQFIKEEQKDLNIKYVTSEFLEFIELFSDFIITTEKVCRFIIKI